MKFGFDLFKFNYLPSPDLEFMEKEIAQLSYIWHTKEEWDQFIKDIGSTAFRDVNCENLDEIGDDYMRKLKGLPRE
jgi:dynein heavy chain